MTEFGEWISYRYVMLSSMLELELSRCLLTWFLVDVVTFWSAGLNFYGSNSFLLSSLAVSTFNGRDM